MAIRATQRRQLAIRIGLPLLAAVWFVGTLCLFGDAVLTAGTFFGEPPHPGDVARAHRLLFASIGVALGLPLLGLALNARRRSRFAVWFFVAALLVGATYAAAAGLELYHQRPGGPPPVHGVGCQEYSGGGTHCPGG